MSRKFSYPDYSKLTENEQKELSNDFGIVHVKVEDAAKQLRGGVLERHHFNSEEEYKKAKEEHEEHLNKLEEVHAYAQAMCIALVGYDPHNDPDKEE